MTRAATTLGPSLEIRDVEAVRAVLLTALEGASAVRVEVSSLVTVDTAGAQLLLALRNEGVLRGVEIEFAGQSAALSQILSQLGLGAALAGAAHGR